MTDRIELLKSVRLLSSIPPSELPDIAKLLSEEAFADGKAVFSEGDPGDHLYFVSSGAVSIVKRLQGEGSQGHKELALLGPGEAFGEMALVESLPRSADAVAKGPTKLLRLSRADLNAWLKAHPGPGAQFFSQLVQTLSGRLRSSSDELTLLFDLSQFLLEPFAGAKDLLDKTMKRLMAYLQGDWSAGAWVYNQFNEEMELVDVEGDFEAARQGLSIPGKPETGAWLDERTFQVPFPGRRRLLGYIVFRHAKKLSGEDKNEFARTVTTTARLVATALDNLAYRTEDDLRARLKNNSQGGYSS